MIDTQDGQKLNIQNRRENGNWILDVVGRAFNTFTFSYLYPTEFFFPWCSLSWTLNQARPQAPIPSSPSIPKIGRSAWLKGGPGLVSDIVGGTDFVASLAGRSWWPFRHEEQGRDWLGQRICKISVPGIPAIEAVEKSPTMKFETMGPC